MVAARSPDQSSARGAWQDFRIFWGSKRYLERHTHSLITFSTTLELDTRGEGTPLQDLHSVTPLRRHWEFPEFQPMQHLIMSCRCSRLRDFNNSERQRARPQLFKPLCGS